MRAALLALALVSPAHAGDGWLTDLAAAKSAAAAARKPILVDFQAVWCYSCYYMEENVLSKEGFKKAAEGLILLKLDVDTPDGAALKKRLKAGYLPSYVLMDSSERELGRIIGEKTESEFLGQLERLLAGGAATSSERVLAALDAGDLEAAERWYRESSKFMPEGDAGARLSARMAFARAVSSKRHGKAVAAFAELMRLGGGCELPYHVYRASESLVTVGSARRRDALEAARAALVPVVEERWFGAPDRRCADGRSLFDSLAEVYKGLGMEAERRVFIDRVADELERRLTAAGVGDDRNLDDDARYAFELALRGPALEALLRKLVDAYPSDYVYAGRLAGFLSKAGRAGEALPFSERAFRLSYGGNRPAMAALFAKNLAASGRVAEAKAILRLEFKVAKDRFPKAAPPLEALLKKLGG